MCNHTIYEQTVKVQKKYDTRNPFQLLQAMKADVRESYQYSRLKGYCYYANRSTFVVINGLLMTQRKRSWQPTKPLTLSCTIIRSCLLPCEISFSMI
ncbi:MAG: hypothetical protein ACLR23_10395 [Clostridia bacterium]